MSDEPRDASPPAHPGGSLDISLANLTLVGWLLTLLTIGIIVVLMFLSAALWNDIVRVPPIAAKVLTLPGLAVGVGFFILSAAKLKSIGLPAFKQLPEPKETHPGAPLSERQPARCADHGDLFSQVDRSR